MNSTISPWMMIARLPASCGGKMVGSSARVEVPTSRPPNSRAASAMPTAELRPSSATAMPMNPTWLAAMSLVTMWYSQPSTSQAPARPAKAPPIERAAT